MNVTYVWLLGGTLFVIAELLGIHNIGLLFAGLGALIVGTLTGVNAIAGDDTVIQFVAFFVATAIWAAILWKPLQVMRNYKIQNNYNNIVGEIAFVGSGGLTKAAPGEVTWAGTIMRAELSRNTPSDRIEAGSQVTIVEVAGNTLIVKPKA